MTFSTSYRSPKSLSRLFGDRREGAALGTAGTENLDLHRHLPRGGPASIHHQPVAPARDRRHDDDQQDVGAGLLQADNRVEHQHGGQAQHQTSEQQRQGRTGTHAAAD